MELAEALSKQELQALRERSDRRATRMVVVTWLSIAAIFALPALWPNPLTILAAIALLGGRQLALAAHMHECGHNTFVAGKSLNQLVGRWLAAYPIVSDMDRYSKGHRYHHRLAGTDKDPDLPNYQSYPVTWPSLRRKVIRDLTGQTGWKLTKAAWRAGRSRLRLTPAEGNSLLGQAISNGAMLALLWLAGHPELYLLWVIAWLTTFPLISRLRQAAEHASVPDLFDLDARLNTRTMHVRWYERPFLAPNYLNYHLEHHLNEAIPCYRLRDMHRLLTERGFYDGVEFPKGYGQLFERLIREPSEAPRSATTAAA